MKMKLGTCSIRVIIFLALQHLRSQELERSGAAEVEIVGPIDRAHRTGANALGQYVARINHAASQRARRLGLGREQDATTR